MIKGWILWDVAMKLTLFRIVAFICDIGGSSVATSHGPSEKSGRLCQQWMRQCAARLHTKLPEECFVSISGVPSERVVKEGVQ